LPREMAPRRFDALFRTLIVIVCGVCGVWMVALTWRWPLMWDAQVMHYANFLIRHGFVPYRDITDMNLPGSYVVEGAAMRIFGGGDLAWRLYDFSLLGVVTASMIVIALPYDWIAGLFAGVTFALIHASEGPQNGGQRDEAMTALLLLGYALLFLSIRHRKIWGMLGFGMALGLACSIKPTTAPLAAVLLGMAGWKLRKDGERAATYVWVGLLGLILGGAPAVLFLLHYHSLGAFLEITRTVTPYYATLQHETVGYLIQKLLPKAALTLPFALLVAVTNRTWKNWERSALLLGVASGALSYFAQRKGFLYHRYMFVAFLLLWMGIELLLAMRRTGWARAVGIAGLALSGLIFPLVYVARLRTIVAVNHYSTALEHDLTQLGGASLDRRVQCLDLVDGCFNALYHDGLVQATGSMGDLLYFPRTGAPVVASYRARFREELKRNSPAVIVVSNEWFNEVPSFDKLAAWPEFAAYLESDYRLVVERSFPDEFSDAYRIYVRKNMAAPRLDPGYGWQ